jgi:hypothetical protein
MGDSRYGRCASPAQEVFAVADSPIRAVRMAGILVVAMIEARVALLVTRKTFLY